EVDDVAPGPRAVEAREELDRRLGVERTAAAAEQGGLLVHARVGVQLEQLALDLCHLLGARLVRALVLDDDVVLVEVVQVIRRDDAEPPHELVRRLGVIPSYYLHYFYERSEEHTSELQSLAYLV